VVCLGLEVYRASKDGVAVMTFDDLQDAYMAAWMAYMRRLRNEPSPEERRRAFVVIEGGKKAA
jgi:hypothetical protein